MSTAEHGSWDDFSRAAEQFARRVARDARRFATRLEEDVGEFAHDVRRHWHHCSDSSARSERYRSPEDVRRVFQDIRTVLTGVLDGVDELIASVFPQRADEGWTRVVLNRDASCAGCARAIAAGSEAFLRRSTGTKEFRCLECGAPAE